MDFSIETINLKNVESAIDHMHEELDIYKFAGIINAIFNKYNFYILY